MRTNIEINDALMKKALKVSGLATKRAAVEEGLRLLISLSDQTDVRELFGKFTIDNDIDQSRLDRRF